MKRIILDGTNLTLFDIIKFINNPEIKIGLCQKTLDKVKRYRNQVDRWIIEDSSPIYGINTGLGKLKDQTVKPSEQELFQKNILYSHAAGTGESFYPDIVKIAMLIRANVFMKGHSGVRPELISRITDFLNNGIIPVVPSVGSLGVGDLQPMAHLGLALCGYKEGIISCKGKTGNATDVLKAAGISAAEFNLAAREALALMSGSTFVLAGGIYSYIKAKKLSQLIDGILALSLEAIRGEANAFDPRIHQSRGINGQVESAENIVKLINDSELITSKARELFGETLPRVQDEVSFRSSPQIHGALREILNFAEKIFTQECNASTDNPLIFENEEGGFNVLSGGNYHGGLLSYTLDMLTIALTDIGMLSERRSARLIDPAMSYGLPANLISNQAGLNTGFALVQATAADLVTRMKILSTPASVQSIPAKGNQEDHNAMGNCTLDKLLTVISHLEYILAIELILSSQAIGIILEKNPDLKQSPATAKLYNSIRENIPYVKSDIYAKDLIDKTVELVTNDVLINITEHFTLK